VDAVTVAQLLARHFEFEQHATCIEIARCFSTEFGSIEITVMNVHLGPQPRDGKMHRITHFEHRSLRLVSHSQTQTLSAYYRCFDEAPIANLRTGMRTAIKSPALTDSELTLEPHTHWQESRAPGMQLIVMMLRFSLEIVRTVEQV
jgi:hypothetical protein